MIRRRWLPAIGIGIVLATATVLATVAVVNAASSERHGRLEDLANAEADRIVLALERQLVEMERLTSAGGDPADFRVAAQPRIDLVPELTAVALARVDGDRLVVRTVVPNDRGIFTTGGDLATGDELDILLTRALDEADAAAGTPFDIDGRRQVAVVAPIIGDEDAFGEADRRSAVIGVVIGAVDAATLLGDSLDGERRLVAPDGREIGDAGAEGALVTRAVEIRGRPWTFHVDAPPATWPVSAWLVLGIGLTLSTALAAAYHVQVVRRREAEHQARNRSLQLERIAEAGARLQQSLDLGDLLPAFSVALGTAFDLQAVSIALIDDDGNLVEAFATGERPATEPGDRTATIDLPLRRGWRAVGVLTVRPGRPLDPSELTSIQAHADLLAVAMSNAQLYEREQLNAARLRDLDALKNAFLGTVSHELRTSMTAIMGFGELLADAWDNLDDDRRREMANRIRRSAGSLRHLVDDLLDFARLEQERLRVSPRAVDLAGIVSQTVDGLAPLLSHHELVLQVDDDLQAWADPVAVERILANLVSNAAKYSPHGSTVTITAHAADGMARLVVADQGPGIPADERRRIFARFYRLDTPESVRSRGAGIGLAILRDFADRSGASVTVDDAPGGGARFTVDFPTRPVDTGDASLAVAT